ncbi:hypothetical protein ACQJBY_038503 [Aegilops geniculata]
MLLIQQTDLPDPISVSCRLRAYLIQSSSFDCVSTAAQPWRHLGEPQRLAKSICRSPGSGRRRRSARPARMPPPCADLIRSIDRGGPAGGVGGGDARQRPAAHNGAGRTAGWRWDREADMAEEDGPWLFLFFLSHVYTERENSGSWKSGP